MVTAAVVLLVERFLTLISQRILRSVFKVCVRTLSTNYQHVAKSISFQATSFRRQHPADIKYKLQI